MTGFVGKGGEILKCLAEDGPCTQYYLREKKHWSSRTVWKQIHRLERDRLIHRTAEGYEVTDHGFYMLIVESRRSAERISLLKKAIAKYPNGATQSTLGWMLEKPPPKHDMEKMAIEYLRKPNIFLLCRTDKDGKITWMSVMSHAIDFESDRPTLKVLRRLPSRTRPRWRTIDLR